MFRLSLYLYIFFLLPQLSISQNSEIEQQPLDSILSWMKENYSQDSNDFHGIALRTISKSANIKDLKFMGELHESLADWHGYHGLTTGDSILYHDYKALAYFKELGDQSDIARVYAAISIDQLNNGDLEKSQEATFKAIELYKEIEDEGGLANCHRSLAYLFSDFGEYEKSISYGLQAYDYYKKVGDFDRMSYTLLSLIGTYRSDGQLDKAQEAAKECIDLVNTKIPHQVFVLARAYSYKGRVSFQQDLLDQALKESRMAFDVARAEVGDDRAASYREGIGDVLKAQGLWQEALIHYEAAIITSERQGQHELISKLYESVSECYDELDNTSKALYYYKKYSDDLVETRDEKIVNLETEAVIKYETGKKDEAIANQKNELIKKAKTQQVYVGVVVLLGSLLVGLLYLFRKNKKITSDLEIKNKENEVLLKEIHHRVKNNLQILSSLLSLQSDSEEDQTIVGALQESRNRVESMGLIHQKLYTRDNLTSIKMGEYVKELCDQLEDTYSSTQKSITIASNVQINLADVETAIPLGLIINELITNSMKYAFENEKEGAIAVNLWEEGEELKLVVSDNGQKDTSKVKMVSATNFGTRLIDILSKKLKGKIEVSREYGYQTLITFQRYRLS